VYKGKSIALILPARNEAQSLLSVLNTIPPEVDHVIVADNGSDDSTTDVAKKLGAFVVSEPVAGYGRACLAALKTLDDINPDIVAFADADGSDDISNLLLLLDPIVSGDADFVLEHRIPKVSHSLTALQRFGNRLATSLIHVLWGHLYHDLGPMRAIPWAALKALDMKEQDYGWTVEMQIRALKQGLRVREIPLDYHARIAGKSKVSGNLIGSIRAGRKILWVIFREALSGGSVKYHYRTTVE